MASANPVSVNRTDAGDFELGAKIDGAFISFVTISGDHAAALVAKAKAIAENGDDEPEEEK